MDVAARMSSKGQVTIPKAVRDALNLHEGDDVIFRVAGTQAVLTRTPPFESLAGTIAVPADRRGSAWEDVIRTTRTRRSSRRQ